MCGLNPFHLFIETPLCPFPSRTALFLFIREAFLSALFSRPALIWNRADDWHGAVVGEGRAARSLQWRCSCRS